MIEVVRIVILAINIALLIKVLVDRKKWKEEERDNWKFINEHKIRLNKWYKSQNLEIPFPEIENLCQ